VISYKDLSLWLGESGGIAVILISRDKEQKMPDGSKFRIKIEFNNNCEVNDDDDNNANDVYEDIIYYLEKLNKDLYRPIQRRNLTFPIGKWVPRIKFDLKKLEIRDYEAGFKDVTTNPESIFKLKTLVSLCTLRSFDFYRNTLAGMKLIRTNLRTGTKTVTLLDGDEEFYKELKDKFGIILDDSDKYQLKIA